MNNQDPQNPLGRVTPMTAKYAPELLYPIARQQGRLDLPVSDHPGAVCGEDVWHLWELSWLRPDGVPVARVGRLHVPAHSACLVESKSLKLYLNSLNMAVFASDEAFAATVCQDISAVVGCQVELKLLALDDASLSVQQLPGQCVDQAAPAQIPVLPDASILQPRRTSSEHIYHSHLLRSLCPVTSQPDWGSVVVRLQGAALEPASLLAYILGFRQHQEFHEQCVERMFCDLSAACQPTQLSVQALYCRRGGLDINPWRSSEPGQAPLQRCARH